jgi:hypothetical protein
MPQVKVNSPAFSFVSGQIARNAKDDLIAARGGLVAIKVQPDQMHSPKFTRNGGDMGCEDGVAPSFCPVSNTSALLCLW